VFDNVNIPVLVGIVPLFFVKKMTINEGYRIARIADSKFMQAIAPTVKKIDIEAYLIGPQRLAWKKGLEAMALSSRALVAATAPVLKSTGIPVVSGLTISLDMQITDLTFTQNNQMRDALDVTLKLEYVPRSSVTAIIGEVADLVLAAGTLAVPAISGTGFAIAPGAPI